MGSIHKHKRQEESWGTFLSGHRWMKGQSPEYCCDVQSPLNLLIARDLQLTRLFYFSFFWFISIFLCAKITLSTKHMAEIYFFFFCEEIAVTPSAEESWISTEHITAGLVSICPHLDVCNADVLLWAVSRFPLQSIERKRYFQGSVHFSLSHTDHSTLAVWKAKILQGKIPSVTEPIKNLVPVTSKTRY